MLLLRLARMEDCLTVNRLAQQLFDYMGKWQGKAIVYDRYPETDFQKYIDSENIYVAEVQNQVIGYLYVYHSYRFGPNDEELISAMISDLCVDESFRDSGYGKLMLKEYLKIAKEQGCLFAELDVDKRNERAYSLYHQLGFEITGYHLEVNL